VTKIIAVLLLLGQFEVAVETSTGYFTATYPDTEVAVRQFVRAIQAQLESEPGRFYPCLVHDGSAQDLLHSPIALRIGPGAGHGTSLVRGDRIQAYLASRPTNTLDAKVAEQICLSLMPSNYMQLYPATAGVREFYRRSPRPTDAQIARAGSCEAVLVEAVKADTARPASARMNYPLALGRVRLWASDELDPPAMQHPTYAQAFRAAAARLEPVSPGRDTYLKEHQDGCLRLGLRLD
jgi:hypothetical protein